jgi:hypothetical protein
VDIVAVGNAVVRGWLSRGTKQNSKLVHAKGLSPENIRLEFPLFQDARKLDGGET